MLQISIIKQQKRGKMGFIIIHSHVDFYLNVDRNTKMFSRGYATTVTPIAIIKSTIQRFAMKIVDYRQWIYDKITLYFLDIKYVRDIVLFYHKSLFFFRYSCEQGGKFIEYYMTLNAFALVMSMICSRLHFGGYLIIVCLLLIRLDFATLSMLRFYKPRISLLQTNFPQLNQLHRRTMWNSTFKTVSEAVTNPQVQAVGLAVGGALAWKALDVYETMKQVDMAEADRNAAAIQAQADRDATAAQAQVDREATAVQAEADRAANAAQAQAAREATAAQAQADRDATAAQAKADRDAEDRRHKETLEFERQERAKDRNMANQSQT